ncbi:hypothetical protein R3P38DRAFT_3204134 [Favolaschia claudopus]|uniref:Uncharacterized protein n=1 Tax=Favolaschia claudopus TaxID=2862362 RepID=A0AAW0AS06_9AGAR
MRPANHVQTAQPPSIPDVVLRLRQALRDARARSNTRDRQHEVEPEALEHRLTTVSVSYFNVTPQPRPPTTPACSTNHLHLPQFCSRKLAGHSDGQDSLKIGRHILPPKTLDYAQISAFQADYVSDQHRRIVFGEYSDDYETFLTSLNLASSLLPPLFDSHEEHDGQMTLVCFTLRTNHIFRLKARVSSIHPRSLTHLTRRLQLHLPTIQLNADNTSSLLVTFPHQLHSTPLAHLSPPPPAHHRFPMPQRRSSDGDECAADANYPFSTPTAPVSLSPTLLTRYPLPRSFDLCHPPHVPHHRLYPRRRQTTIPSPSASTTQPAPPTSITPPTVDAGSPPCPFVCFIPYSLDLPLTSQHDTLTAAVDNGILGYYLFHTVQSFTSSFGLRSAHST